MATKQKQNQNPKLKIWVCHEQNLKSKRMRSKEQGRLMNPVERQKTETYEVVVDVFVVEENDDDSETLT